MLWNVFIYLLVKAFPLCFPAQWFSTQTHPQLAQLKQLFDQALLVRKIFWSFDFFLNYASLFIFVSLKHKIR